MSSSSLEPDFIDSIRASLTAWQFFFFMHKSDKVRDFKFLQALIISTSSGIALLMLLLSLILNSVKVSLASLRASSSGLNPFLATF
jgi:hypothetical protein